MKLLAILRFIWHSSLLLGVGLIGGTVTAAGVVMLVTPGPGLVVIVAGLAILATQFAWAERALDKVKQKAIAARDKASARRADRRAAAAGPTEPQDAADDGRASEPVDINIAESRAAESRAAEPRSPDSRPPDLGNGSRTAERRAAEPLDAEARGPESRTNGSRSVESRSAGGWSSESDHQATA